MPALFKNSQTLLTYQLYKIKLEVASIVGYF